MPQSLLTLKELAAYYKVSTRTIQRRVKAGIIKPVGNPCALRFLNPEVKPEWDNPHRSARRQILENFLFGNRKNGKNKSKCTDGM